jgi:hypothetical protein
MTAQDGRTFVTPSAFVSPSTGRQLKAVLFDTFGTVVDWRCGVAAEVLRFTLSEMSFCPDIAA